MAALLKLDLRPNRRMLRQFGFAALAGFGLLAACAWWSRGMFSFGLGAAREPVALIFGGLAFVCLLFSLVYPPGNRPFYLAVSLLAYPIGLVLSPLILGFVFVVVFGPIAILLRLFRRDPLARKYEPLARSYWVKRDGARAAERYFRQF